MSEHLLGALSHMYLAFCFGDIKDAIVAFTHDHLCASGQLRFRYGTLTGMMP